MKNSYILPQQYSPGMIGIATVLFNSEQVLPDFLDSLISQTYRDFILFAVDNASSDRSAELINKEGISVVTTQNADNKGFAYATNQGISQAIQAGCEYVLILNNDIAFGPDFLSLLLEGLKLNKANLAAPLTYYHDRPNIIWAAGGSLQRVFGYRPVHLGMEMPDTGQFPHDRLIQFAPGSCILARRSVFEQIGALDETYFTYWEDTDFAVRALKAKLRFFLIPKARLWHKVSSLTGLNSPFQKYYAVRNHALYIHKHCPPFMAWALTGSYLLWYRISSLRRGEVDPRIKIWKEGIALAAEHK